MLPRNLTEMAKINIYVPHNLETKLFCFFLIVNWRSSNYAVKLLHEKTPISTLEHGKSTVIKAMRQSLWWFLFELNHKFILPCYEVHTLVEFIMVWLSHISDFFVG